MIWRPRANILRPVHRGAGVGCYPVARAELVWPSCPLQSGADYSIDFDALLAPGEYITSFRFDPGDAAVQAWTNLFGTVATAWLRWTKSGPQTVIICALTSSGNSLQLEALISVGKRLSLYPAVPPKAPSDERITITSEMMDGWLQSLPKDPSEITSGWFNNAGIPTRIGDLD